jgi:hypothetical protein
MTSIRMRNRRPFPDVVVSPFAPNALIDVSGIPPGANPHKSRALSNQGAQCGLECC